VRYIGKKINGRNVRADEGKGHNESRKLWRVVQ
jgi:hypothetical protein